LYAVANEFEWDEALVGFFIAVAMGNSFAVAECRAFSPMHDLAYLVTFW